MCPTWPLLALGQAVAIAACCTQVYSQQDDSRSPAGSLEQAEVEPFRYEQPPADLLLDESGVRKVGALLLFYRGISLDDVAMAERLEFFKQAIALDPGNVALAMETATSCAVLGRFAEAHAILEESLEQNRDKRDAYLNLSRYCDAHHNHDDELKQQAIGYAEMAYEKFPTDQVVIEHLITLLGTRDQRDRAIAVLEESLSRDVADGEYWLAMGNIARQLWPMRNEENRARVFGVFEKALQADPTNLPMVERVAQFYKLAGNLDRAIQLYELLIVRSPDRLGARTDLAELYWAAGNQAAAVAALESLVQVNPLDCDTRRKLSQYYQELGDLDRALEQTGHIVEAGLGEVDDFLTLARLQLAADKLGGALQTLRQGVELHPGSPKLSYTLGSIYLRLDRYADAYAAFAEAEAQADGESLSEGFYFDYAIAAERAGKLERAEELLRKSIELVPDEEQEEKAKSLNYLGYMWLEREIHLDEAGEMIQEANRLKPDNGAYLDSLGWFHFLKGDFNQAIQHLQRAAELMEDEPDSVIFEHLARAYHAKGDQAKALRQADRAIELDPENAELKTLREAIDKARSAPPEKADDGETP